MGVGTFSDQTMEVREHRNCSWTDLEWVASVVGRTIQFRGLTIIGVKYSMNGRS